jgi:hypothetical protein
MVDSVWRCDVHRRGLTFPEWKSGGCWWCHPNLIPRLQPVEGKNDRRFKLYEQLRNMTHEERQALIPSPLPGPGVVTPSMAMLAKRFG